MDTDSLPSPPARARGLALTAGLAVLAAPSLAAADGVFSGADEWLKPYVSAGVEAGAVGRDLAGCTRCEGASPTLGFGVQLGGVLRFADGPQARRDGAALVLELWGQTIPLGSADEERRAVQLAELAVVQIWPARRLWLKAGVGGAELVNDGAPGTPAGLAVMAGGGVTLTRTLDLQARLGYHGFGDDGHTTAATVGVGVHWP